MIYTEADAAKIFMGLKTWKQSPQGKILKSDATVARNYLNEEHIRELNRMVSANLDLAENNAQRNQLMYMKNWSKFLNDFLQLSNYPILKDKGKVTMLEAKLKRNRNMKNAEWYMTRNMNLTLTGKLKN